METTCQASYPLNSENESPFGTFKVYLSCAEMAQLPTKANTPIIIGIVNILLPFIANTSFIKFSVLTSLFRLEVVSQFPELLQHQQLPRARAQFLLFQNPRMPVRNENRIQPRLERRVDVGFRALPIIQGPLRIHSQPRQKGNRGCPRRRSEERRVGKECR